jgi:hypothetical protein
VAESGHVDAMMQTAGMHGATAGFSEVFPVRAGNPHLTGAVRVSPLTGLRSL